MRYVFLFFTFSVLGSINAQKGAVIEFKEESFNFGKIEEGPKVSHEFVFKNTGTEPLILSNVKASCGCTTPYWPKEPLMPNEESKILVTYSTNKRSGAFTKTITVSSNATEASKILRITGNVIKAPEEQTMPIKEPLLMAP